MGNLTHTVSGDIASFRSAARVPIESLKCHFLPVQAGSGDASPDNIRPISGWSNIQIYKSKKNLYANGDQTLNSSYIYIQLINPLPPGTYTFSAIITSTDVDSNTSLVRFFGDDGSNPNTAGSDIAQFQIARSVNNSRVSTTFNLNRTASWIYLYVAERYVKGVNDTAHYTDIMIEAVNTTNEYEEYQGQTYTINWTNDADTLYGGYVDIIKGELVAEYKLLTITGDESNLSINWDGLLIPVPDSVSDNGSQIVIACSHTNNYITGVAFWSTARNQNPNTNTNNICVAGSLGSQLRFRKRDLDPNYTRDIELYKTWLRQQNTNGTPLQIVYKLTTPVIYQLTSQQLKTFLDQNNIWSNTNDITEVSYYIHDSYSMVSAKKRIIAASPRIENVASGNTQDSTKIAHFITDISAPLKICRIDFSPLQWGLDTPSPDNIRTIRGWNTIPIHVAGRNLLEHDTSGSGTFVRTSFTNNTDGSITLTRNSTGSAHIGINNISESSRTLAQQNWMKKVLPAGTYKNYMTTSSGSLTAADALGYLLQSQYTYDNAYSTEHSTSTSVTIGTPGTGNVTSTIPEDALYTWYRIYSGGSTYPAGTVTLYPAVFLNSETDTSYEKFSGYTINIELPETIYGGYIDLIRGELVATYASYTIDNDTVFYNSVNNPTNWVSIHFDKQVKDIIPIKSYTGSYQYRGELCDKIGPYTASGNVQKTLMGTYENGKFYNNIYIYNMGNYNSSITSAEALNNYLKELAPTFVYPIEPITYQIDPITLNTLRGVNNVWSDAGTVSLSYWTH